MTPLNSTMRKSLSIGFCLLDVSIGTHQAIQAMLPNGHAYVILPINLCDQNVSEAVCGIYNYDHHLEPFR